MSSPTTLIAGRAAAPTVPPAAAASAAAPRTTSTSSSPPVRPCATPTRRTRVARPASLAAPLKDYGGDRAVRWRRPPQAASIATIAAAASIATIAAAASAVIATTTATRATARIASSEGPSRADADDNWGRSSATVSLSRDDRYDDRRGGYDRGYDRYDDRRGGDRFDDRRSRSPSPRARLGRASQPPRPPPRRSRPRRGGGFPRLLPLPSPSATGALRNRPGPPPRGGRERSRSPSPERDWNSLAPPGAPPATIATIAEDLARVHAPTPPAIAGERPIFPLATTATTATTASVAGALVSTSRRVPRMRTPAPASGGGGGISAARALAAALKEAGRDFIKEDLALSRGAGVRRKEHPDEKAIKDDIAEMNARLATMEDGEEKEKLKTTVGEAETALAKLSLELDDKGASRSGRREKDAAEGAEGAEGANGQRRGGRAAGERASATPRGAGARARRSARRLARKGRRQETPRGTRPARTARREGGGGEHRQDRRLGLRRARRRRRR